MKTDCYLRISIVCSVVLCLFSTTTIAAGAQKGTADYLHQPYSAANRYLEQLEHYAKYVEVISGGFHNGNKVIIRIGDHTFYENIPYGPLTAGLYVVAIHKDEVLLQCHYKTYGSSWAGEWLAWDIDKLPEGTFVIAAVKDEATRRFDEKAQRALYQIGAEKGLLGQEYRTSYFCLGIKGLPQGKAIERVGMEELKYAGPVLGKHIELVSIDEKEFSTPISYNRHEFFKRVEGEKGKIVKKELTFGSYLQYIPRRLTSRSRILVIVHGTPGENESTINLADRFIKRWVSLAEKRELILLAPAFDQKNFSVGPGGGYRGLFGREIGADDFVNRIIDRYKGLSPSFDGRFYLYGHSAGGQFVSRYVVEHPQQIIAAVISAAGTFAFPDPNVPWTNGMARLRRKMQWGESDKLKDIDIEPDTEGWLMAAQLPITVVVGAEDTEKIEDIPGQKGNDHVERGRHWVKDMNELAKRSGKKGRVRLRTVPKVGHSSARLTPVCMKHLFRR